MINLSGQVVSMGNMDVSELPPLLAAPRVQFAMSNGRIVTLSGLTMEECRSFAPLFLSDVIISIAGST